MDLSSLLFGVLLLGAPGSDGVEEMSCPRAVSDATIWFHQNESNEASIDEVVVRGVFFRQKPSPKTEALVLAYPSGAQTTLRVEGTTYDEEVADPLWQVHLQDAVGTPLQSLEAPPHRRPEAPSDAVVIWPAPEERSTRLVSPESLELPETVSPGMVKAAVRIGENEVVLIVEFCCGDRSTTESCEYHCGEVWLRIDGDWRRCSAWQPA